MQQAASTTDARMPGGPCQICGGRDYRLEIEWQGWRYYRCETCDLVFLHPLPAMDELAERYGDSDSALTAAYFSKVPSKLKRARIRARIIAKRMPQGTAGKRFLDVGCSGGFVTEAAREAGFIATGLDPDGSAIEWARKTYPANSYFHGMVEDFAAGATDRFDAIYCSEVLEHVADVNGFLGAISRLAADGALLYLTTPDIGHWRRPRRLPDWDVFTPPHHCIFFSRGNLAAALAKHGFEIIERRPSWKPGLKVIARKRPES
jgi:SAM-dependent methyltransferase